MSLNTVCGDFPGGPVVKNPPYNAEDTDSIPGQGTKIPHAVGQLSPRATTTGLCASTRAHAPQLQSPRALEPTTREKAACHNEEPACHNEESRMPQQRPDAAKNKLSK